MNIRSTTFLTTVLGLTVALGLVACGGNSTVVDDPDSGTNNNNNNNSAAVCGNGVIETGEDCDTTALGGLDCTDLNLGTGDLTCTDGCTYDTSDCSEQPECGNGELEYGESCDGSDLGGQDCAGQGLGTGTLDCTSSCTYDTSGCAWCGNDAVDSGEDCDGSDLDGQTCETQGLGAGTLVCTPNCGFDTSGCGSLCGNGNVDTGEQCDGVNLGGNDCTDRGFVGGTLTCTGTCAFDESLCSNCETPDNTAPTASNHVPAPETQGAAESTAIAADLFDSCGVDTSSVSMRITITPKFGSASVLSVTPTTTGSGTSITATYNHPGGFDAGDIVEVLLTANDINSNSLAETWRFSVVDQMQLWSGGSGGATLTNPIDESQPNTNLSSMAGEELIGGAAGSERRYLIRFNPAVPAGALIITATLSAAVCPPGATVTTTLDCYQLNVDSHAAQSTWNNRLTATAWSTPGADAAPADRGATAAGAIPFDSTSTPYTWVDDDVTPMVASWATGAGFYGIVCMNESATQIPICSPFSNAPPKIDVTFGPPLP